MERSPDDASDRQPVIPPASSEQNVAKDGKARWCPTCKHELPVEHFLADRSDYELAQSCIKDRLTGSMIRDFRKLIEQQKTHEQARAELMMRAAKKVEDWMVKVRDRGSGDDDSQNILSVCQQKLEDIASKHSSIQESSAAPAAEQTILQPSLIVKLKLPQRESSQNAQVSATPKPVDPKRNLRERRPENLASNGSIVHGKQKGSNAVASLTHDAKRLSLRGKRPRASTPEESGPSKKRKVAAASASSKQNGQQLVQRELRPRTAPSKAPVNPNKQKIVDDAKAIINKVSGTAEPIWNRIFERRRGIESMTAEVKALQAKIDEAKFHDSQDVDRIARIQQTTDEASTIIASQIGPRK